MPIRKSCRYFVTIFPGYEPAPELAKKVRNAILSKCLPDDHKPIESIPISDFEAQVPSGNEPSGGAYESSYPSGAYESPAGGYESSSGSLLNTGSSAELPF